MTQCRTPSRRQDDGRRNEFVRAAIRVIAREGVRAATTRRVAEEAGLPAGLFHYWFAGKRELFEAVIRDVLDDLDAAPVAGNATDSLAHRWTASFDVVRSDEPGRQLATYELTAMALRSTQLRELAREQYTAYRKMALRSVTPWFTASGSSIDPEVLAALVSALFDGLTLAWLADPAGTPADEVLSLLAELLDVHAKHENRSTTQGVG